MPTPKIISVCSKCSIKSNMCKLVQNNKSKNYSIICSECYINNNNADDIVLNIINYNEIDKLENDSCIQKYKKYCIHIKDKIKLLGYKIINYCKLCCQKNINNDTIKLYKIV